MKLNNFNAIYAMAESLYGVNADPEDLEDVALIGWELIGNKHTKLYRYICETTNCRIKLPCNVDIIESVTIPILDSQKTGPEYDGIDFNAQYIEAYTEAHKINNPTIYRPGKYLKYRLEGDTLVFDQNYAHVCVLYHGIIVDEEGLPYLSDKELYALAVYIAYSNVYKKGLLQKDGNLIQLAGVLKADWLRACTAARVSEYLNQNDMDAIADVHTRWDRKMYGKSFKPII